MWLFLLLVAAGIAYAFRGSLTVWWAEVRGAEREIVDLEQDLARAEEAAWSVDGTPPAAMVEALAAARRTIDLERQRLADEVATFERGH